MRALWFVMVKQYKISGTRNQDIYLEMSTFSMLMVLYMFCLLRWWHHWQLLEITGDLICTNLCVSHEISSFLVSQFLLLGCPQWIYFLAFSLRMFSNEDVTIGSWMLAMNVQHEDNRALCDPRCTPTSIAVWDIPKCSGKIIFQESLIQALVL